MMRTQVDTNQTAYQREDLTRDDLISQIATLQSTIARAMRGPKLPPHLSDALSTMTLHQLEAMSILADGPLSMSELAQILKISESSATSLVDRLVRSNNVRRGRSENDRRVVTVELTPKANDVIDAYRSHRLEVLSSVLLALSTEELQTLLDLFVKLTTQSESPGK